METFPQQPETSLPKDFDKFEEINKEYVNHKTKLAEVQRLLGQIKIESNPDTWVSSTRNSPDGVQISLGEKELPKDVLERWGWGVHGAAEQYLVKVAHEHAHLIQQEFDGSLLKFLDGSNEVEKTAYPYIQLYALLSQIGIINGLAQENIYHEQNRTTGNLSVPTYEDIAETLGSSLLSRDYFLYRMKRSNSPITPEQIQEIETFLNKVLENFKQKRQSD